MKRLELLLNLLANKWGKRMLLLAEQTSRDKLYGVKKVVSQ